MNRKRRFGKGNNGKQHRKPIHRNHRPLGSPRRSGALHQRLPSRRLSGPREPRHRMEPNPCRWRLPMPSHERQHHRVGEPATERDHRRPHVRDAHHHHFPDPRSQRGGRRDRTSVRRVLLWQVGPPAPPSGGAFGQLRRHRRCNKFHVYINPKPKPKWPYLYAKWKRQGCLSCPARSLACSPIEHRNNLRRPLACAIIPGANGCP